MMSTTSAKEPWLNSWEVLEPLGKGGQGSTYRVRSRHDSSIEGALKILNSPKKLAARQRMAREIASLRLLASVGGRVPDLLEDNIESLNEEGSRLYVVMAIADGSTLQDYIQESGVMPINDCLEVALSILDTIEIAHREGIVHRDLKPDNLVLSDREALQVTVIDFGLAFNNEVETITETEETFRNKFVDLPETNTPNGAMRDPRSDLTCVCAVVYFMLTGHRVGQLQDGSGLMPHQRAGLTVPDESLSAAGMAQLKLLFNRGFASDLVRRHQSSADLRRDLEAVRSSLDQADNPWEVASRLTAGLRAGDRKTQLREAASWTDKTIGIVKSSIDVKYAEKLELFQLRSNDIMGGSPMKPGWDPISKAVLWDIRVKGHQASRRYAIRTFYGPGEAVLVEGEPDERRPGRHSLPETWSEIARFDKEGLNDAATLGVRAAEQWLMRAMPELTAEILEADLEAESAPLE